MFDNAPSHQRHADNALSAKKMPKHPNEGWTHRKDGPKMCNGTFGPNKMCQEFYYPLNHPTMPSWFKGMEQIICEHNLWPEKGMLTQCPGFKCSPGCTDCCCRCLLFYQPDFMAQKSELEEFITMWGHICDFYLKFYCKLNFIEQYWGAVKYHYWSTAKTADMDAMEQNVLECLDEVPLLQIKRYVTKKNKNIEVPLNWITDMRTILQDSFQHMRKACQAQRWFGQIGNTMVIRHCLLILYKTLKMLSESK